MKVWAIVPVKGLSAAKSRLAPVLSLRQRRRLVSSLLLRTLATLQAVRRIGGVLVVSKDPAVRRMARGAGAGFIREGPHDGLNRAVARAAAEAVRRGAEAVLVLPADLPLVDPREIRKAIRAAGKPPAVVLVPDRTDRGTNLLLLAPPGIIPFRFGKNSNRRHYSAARKAGVRPVRMHLPSAAEDVDHPEDLFSVQDLGWEGLEL
jgi:2-phospho-L-lactate guanylyltransferase